jgi:hypothetical protein
MWTFIGINIIIISAMLFIMVYSTKAAIEIDRAEYKDAHTNITTVAVVTGVTASISLGLLILSLYITFRPTRVAAAAAGDVFYSAKGW